MRAFDALMFNDMEVNFKGGMLFQRISPTSQHVLTGKNVQYRHFIPAPVDRTFANVWLYKHP